MGDLHNIVTLKNENGEDVHFEFLDLIEYKDNEYVVLLPVLKEGEEDEGEVVILLIESIDEENNSEIYVSVEDMDDLEAVFDIFKAKFKEEFNFIDE